MTSSDRKALQARKIAELRAALEAAGFRTLGEQSVALGLCRSTAWNVKQALHKGSGLSASVISQMLHSPCLPDAVRNKLLEYVEEKTSGYYGHDRAAIARFKAALHAQ